MAALKNRCTGMFRWLSLMALGGALAAISSAGYSNDNHAATEAAQEIIIELAEGKRVLARVGCGFGIEPVAMRVAPHVGFALRRARAGGALRVGPVGRGFGIGNDHDKGSLCWR